MKLFGTKAARQSARPVLARAWGAGGVTLGEWPASYEAQLRAGVIGNPVAQRALRLVTEGAGATILQADGVAQDQRARVMALISHCSAGQSLVETLAGQCLRQLPGGEPGAVAADDPAVAGEDLRGAGAGAARLVAGALPEGGPG